MENYLNQRASQVEALLRDKGLVVEVQRQPSETVTQDFIISQTPEEGTRLSEGDTVTLVVSSGPEVETMAMISVVGQPLETATELLEKMGLIVSVSKELYDDLQPVGYVVNQSIEQGVDVRENTIISLQVSKGPDPNGEEPTAEPTADPTQSPTPSVSPSPSTEPTPSPQPSVALVSKQITIDLPTDQDIVHVTVTVGGDTQFDDDVDTALRRVRPPLTASGTGVAVCIYFDDVLVETRYEDFVK